MAHLELVILAVSDLGAAVRFYREVFGFEAKVETPVYVELAAPGGSGIGLYLRDGFARNTGEAPAPAPAGTTATELYFVVTDLEAACARLEAAGARLLSASAPRDWGHVAAYFRDPDGNVVVVSRPA